MKFADKQIESILDSATVAYRSNKLSKTKEQNFLLTLKGFLRKSGMIKDVCPECLGTGMKRREE